MVGKKKEKMQAPQQQKVVTRVVRVPTPVKAPVHRAAARQHQVYGFAGPQLPPPTATMPQTAQQQSNLVVRQSMKKGFAAPNITAKPIRPARLAQPKLTRPTADPFKVRRKR